jgi:hypothetical protein
MEFYYTTYDVRRKRDIIHPGSNMSHRDIMGLLDPDEQDGNSRFWYAHVLGIFHANIIYTGEGALDHIPRRLDFLWVRYYTHLRSSSDSESLQMLSLPSVTVHESFGFVDPSLVLRCCHVIPAFYKGRRTSRAASGFARSEKDWNAYFLNRLGTLPFCVYFFTYNSARFADQDMFMRFKWGLGVGHTYCHEQDGQASDAEGAGLSKSPGDADRIIQINAEPEHTSWEPQGNDSTGPQDEDDPALSTDDDERGLLYDSDDPLTVDGEASDSDPESDGSEDDSMA